MQLVLRTELPRPSAVIVVVVVVLAVVVARCPGWW